MSLYVLLIIGIISSRTYGSNITGNPDWDGLFSSCWKKSSFTCVQNGLRKSLERALEGDLTVTESINFVKNQNKYSAAANAAPIETNPVENDEDFANFVNAVESSEATFYNSQPRLSKSPKSVDGITDILYNKGVHYLMNHDLNLDLPEPVFGGGRVRLSPRSIEEDGGVIVKINFDEPQKAEGRIFFKKIKQFFKQKLMTSFMAAMLIIKLVKVKMMFLLPLIVGVSTAKKILLKVLLFLFPALTHLFKLCAYYHHHHTKWSHHYHHHHGAHHHHHHTPPVYIPAPPIELDHPPPGATIVHRSEPENELSQWGITYEEPKNEDHLSRVYTVQGAQAQPYRAQAPQVYSPPVEDPFYSAILNRLDRVFGELGFTEEVCKERLVCSMYKAPARFSPHSNLVSAEISRDSSELQKPVVESPSVIRYYKYVQAARNGQDMKDCLSLYPACSLLTE